MSDAIRMVTLVAGAAISLGMALYLLWNNSNPEEPHRHNSNDRRRSLQSPPRRQWSPPSSPSRGQSRREGSDQRRPRRRAISPAREGASTRSPAPTTTSTRINRASRQPGEIRNCPLCRDVMSSVTIELNCGHVFDDECYTIWRDVILTINPHANLCPTCRVGNNSSVT